MADVPLPLGSWTVPSLSYQLLTATTHKNWTPAVIELTHQPAVSLQLLTCTAYNISAWIAQKTPFLCCCAAVAVMPVGVPTWQPLSHCLAMGLHATICFLRFQRERERERERERDCVCMCSRVCRGTTGQVILTQLHKFSVHVSRTLCHPISYAMSSIVSQSQ
jgi:hypothetical protein